MGPLIVGDSHISLLKRVRLPLKVFAALAVPFGLDIRQVWSCSACT